MKTLKSRFYEKIKKRSWQNYKIIQTKWKKFSSKITVLVSYSEHDNVWELGLFI